jgi:hydroxyacylglutathione hydrolase
MLTDIKIISLGLPFRLGNVNCYLIKTDASYVLIDTGSSNKRSDLVRELKSSGCEPGDLKLIIITHGDFDHTGNCAYLREKFSTKVTIHHDDSGMVERGTCFGTEKKAIVSWE